MYAPPNRNKDLRPDFTKWGHAIVHLLDTRVPRRYIYIYMYA